MCNPMLDMLFSMHRNADTVSFNSHCDAWKKSLWLILLNSLFTSVQTHTQYIFSLCYCLTYFTFKVTDRKYPNRQRCNPHNTELQNHCLLRWKPAGCRLKAVNKSVPALPTGLTNTSLHLNGLAAPSGDGQQWNDYLLKPACSHDINRQEPLKQLSQINILQ